MLLGEICQITNGNSIPTKIKEKKFTGISGMPYIATKDISFEGAVNYDNGISISDDELKKFKISPKESILICAEGGSAGRKIAYIDRNCCFVNKLFSIKTSSKILPKFVFYYLKSNIFQSQFKKSLTGLIGGVSLSKIKNFQIIFPELIKDQEKIIAKLDNAFAEIDKSLNLKKLQMRENKMLFKSTLNNCFSERFECMRIEELGQVSSGGTPSSTNPNYWEGNIQWYSSGELNDKFTAKSIKKISHEGLENSNAKIFPKDSLLVGMYDTAAMKMSILSEESTFNQAIVGIAPNKFASTEYLFYALNNLKESILLQRRGVRQQNLSLAKIKKIEVPIPNFKEQKSIVEKLNFISQQSQFYQEYLSKIIDNLLALKSAILSKEFQCEIL